MQEKKSIIAELFALSKVDGQVSDDEVALIKHMGNLMGMSDQEILDAMENPVKFNPEADPLDRIVQFHRLVLLMNIDRYPSDSEIKHLKLMGIKLGLSPGALEEIFTKMKDYPNNVIPPEVLIDIHKKHMN